MREENKEMLQREQSSEPSMNGAAIVLSDGREVPITDTMVRKSLESLAGSASRPHDRSRQSA